MNDSLTDTESESDENISLGTLILRSTFGGVLMGLANLVPGISGGTMLLAAGIYPKFIEAISNVTRFRFKFHSVLTLGCVALAAGLGILLFAGMLKDLVVNHRWIMYSLFIGLTLGGIPVVWKLARPMSNSMIISAIVAFLLMVLLGVAQAYGIVGGGGSNFFLLFVAGLAGASAMILPGVSGGYLLLLIGQYVPILSAIDEFKEALKAKDLSAAMGPAVSVMIPVGIGVVAGIVIVGNLLQWLLKNYPKATLGFLLGLLAGSVVGLFPFQECVAPEVGEVVKGTVVSEANFNDIDPEDWPTRFFSPNTTQVTGSILLMLIGFALTLGVAKIGGSDKRDNRC